MELLSPANTSTLDAALAAGADAVYFGLKRLNARAGALNLSQEELAEAVQRIHRAGAKAHLTLNIDLDTREIALAARTLQLATEAGVDAVIVRDAAVLALREFFPELEFHFSTQCGVSSSAGVRAARTLGCDRAVLARELTAAEVAAASLAEGIATEVFIQGAMCFCASGRCLLSSWVGGRSGNRGACASPCRVAWRHQGQEQAAHPMSMHDLCLLNHLEELRQAGVASLKIEGRLKSADWVTRAVSLYRQALDNPSNADSAKADELGRYTGRAITAGYYAEVFSGITGESAGRSSWASAASPTCSAPPPPPEDRPRYSVKVSRDAQGGICLAFAFGESNDNLRIPPQRVVKANRAVPLGDAIDEAMALLPEDSQLDCPQELRDTLLPRRCQATLTEAVTDFRRRATKPEDDGNVRIAIPNAVRAALDAGQNRVAPENRLHLGDIFDRIRVGFSQIVILPEIADVINGRRIQLEVALDRRCTPRQLFDGLEKIPQQFQDKPVVIALPQVCYENELAELAELLRECAGRPRQVTVQLNSWDTLQLARENGITSFETGNGLAVLNPLAADFLRRLGAECVAVSPEIDRRKLEALCEKCGTPLNLTIFGRPALMTTRAQLPDGFAPDDSGRTQTVFSDARGVELSSSCERGLTILRPTKPFDWRRISNAEVRVTHLVCDLCASSNPAMELRASAASPFLFNYDRTLR